jgi:hypothetical protein
MIGAIPPLPHVFMAWCLVKHRDNFTITVSVQFSLEKGEEQALPLVKVCQLFEQKDNRLSIGRFIYIKEEPTANRFDTYTRVYPKVSGLAAWSENCKWYSSLPLGAVVSLFCEPV